MSFLIRNKLVVLAFGVFAACGFPIVAAESSPQTLTGVAQAEIAKARLQKEERARQAQLHISQGQQLLRTKKYQEALEQFVLAVNLDPSSREASAGRIEALRYLESRPSIGNNSAQMVYQEKVRQELGLAEVTQQLAMANKYLSEALQSMEGLSAQAKIRRISDNMKTLTEAENAAVRAKLRVDSLSATIRPEERDSIRDQISKLQLSIRDQKLMQRRALEEISRSVAFDVADKEKQEIVRIENSQRDYILQAAKSAMAKTQYEEALLNINEMLRLNPADVEARQLKEQCKLQELRYRSGVIRDLEQENRKTTMENIQRATISEVSPRIPLRFPANWAVMKKQKAMNKENEMVGTAVLTTRRTLENSYSFEFVETEFSLILNTIHNNTGLNIVVDKGVRDSNVMVEPLTFSFRNMRLDNILNWIMRATKLRYQIANTGILTILTKESENAESSFEIVDVRDIAFAVTNAKKMPEDTTNGEIEEDEDDGEENAAADNITLGVALNTFINKKVDGAEDVEPEIEITENGQLIMKAPESIRAQVHRLLEQLRSAQTIQVSVSARFLSLQDNFWEQFRSEFMDWNNNGQVTAANQSQYQALSTSNTPNMVSYPNNSAAATLPSDQYANNSVANALFNPGSYYSQALGSFSYGTFSGLSSVFGAEANQNSATMSSAGLIAQMQQLGFLGSLQSQWFIQMVRQTDRADELFCPQLVVYNNRYGWIKFNNRYPYISAYSEGDGDSGMVPTISYIDEGSSLQVRPSISADRKYITVDVRPRVVKILNKRQNYMSFTYAPIVTVIRSVFDPITMTWEDEIFSTTSTTTKVLGFPVELPSVFRHDSKTYAIIPDGGAIMITGLSTNVDSQGRQGVPLLQDLPFVGNAFSSRYYQKDKRSYACLVNARMIILDEEEARQVGTN